VGPVTAAAFVATIDDAQRVHRAHEVEAYLGLVPREWRPGERQHRGRITKAGHTRMRWWLVQAAVSIRRLRDPQTVALRHWAMGIATRRGKKIAVVALARRLAGILYVMLRGGNGCFREYPDSGPGHRTRPGPTGRSRFTRVRLRAPEKSGPVRGEMSGTLVSRRFDGWVSAYVDVAAVRAPWRRWHPHPSTPLMRRRAPLAPDEREEKDD
jgi:hypothetical protein